MLSLAVIGPAQLCRTPGRHNGRLHSGTAGRREPYKCNQTLAQQLSWAIRQQEMLPFFERSAPGEAGRMTKCSNGREADYLETYLMGLLRTHKFSLLVLYPPSFKNSETSPYSMKCCLCYVMLCFSYLLLDRKL